MRETDEFPADILAAAENALDMLLCNCTESCGGADGLRQESIKDIARALLAERERAARIVEGRVAGITPRTANAIAAAIRS